MAAVTGPKLPLTSGMNMEELYDGLMSGNEREDFEIKQSELENLKKALKDDNFRKMLSDYVEEVRDPENQKTFQSEYRQLERERGNVVHFINPCASYVLKSSVNGEKKCFINICSNTLIQKPKFEAGVQDNKQGSIWSIPYTQSQGREDYDKSGLKCMIYDVIFHPDAMGLAERNSLLREKLEQTAIEAVETSFNVTLDKVNIRRPKLKYKGMRNAVTIKYKIGDEPPNGIDPAQFGNELPPESDEVGTQSISQSAMTNKTKNKGLKEGNSSEPCVRSEKAAFDSTKISNQENTDYSKWTTPKFNLSYRSKVDMQDYCTEFQRMNINSSVPDEIIVTVDLPLLKDSSTLDADVVDDGDAFELKSDDKALYHLKLKFPYRGIPDSAKASFDKDKRKLVVSVKILKTSKPTSITKPSSVKNRVLEQETDETDRIDGATEVPLQALIEEPFEEGDSPPSSSPPEKKTVRFSDDVKRQIYRSNSSILGQKKKNQRKAKNKKKARERLNSVESISSLDEDEESGAGDAARIVRERFSSGGSVSSLDDDELAKYSSSY